MEASTFLTAEWRNLVMLSWEVEPSLLSDLVPEGCVLDDWRGRTLVSVVGFQFLDTRIKGLPVPGHRDFEEVNLRFYVRRDVGGERRRGVVFVKELVPRKMVAAVARWVYGERYEAMPMSHALGPAPGPDGGTDVAYRWKHRGRWEEVRARFGGDPVVPEEDSEEAFVTEHYWGYSRHRGATVEYRVEHPRWRVWPAAEAAFRCDGAALYGERFGAVLAGVPSSAFVAEGSPVTVRRGVRLEPAEPAEPGAPTAPERSTREDRSVSSGEAPWRSPVDGDEP